jgi:hypothetical protein
MVSLAIGDTKIQNIDLKKAMLKSDNYNILMEVHNNGIRLPTSIHLSFAAVVEIP